MTGCIACYCTENSTSEVPGTVIYVRISCNDCGPSVVVEITRIIADIPITDSDPALPLGAICRQKI